MRYFIILISITVTILLVSCDSDAKVITGYDDGSELNEGDFVPFLLEQNYPNPFNPITTIMIRVGVSLHLKLEIYTDDWQKVCTLIEDDFQENTIHSFIFDGINSDGEVIPSGSYFYTLEGGGVILIRKMTVLK